MRKNKSGFTLVELIVVLVILAMIALIVTPLVIRVIDRAESASDKRSIDGYGKSIDIAIAKYLLEEEKFPTSIDELTIEYTGNDVECKVREINEDGSIFLTRCYVEGIKVKDSTTNDGWYHYGKSNIMPYQTYKIGDVVIYNDVRFYVIMNSYEDDDVVMLLKADPLTVEELNAYSGHTIGITGTKYGFMDYDSEAIISIVNNWSNSIIGINNLKEDVFGYKARIIKNEDLLDRLGYENNFYSSSGGTYKGTIDFVPTWVYNNEYSYWIMRDDKHIWDSVLTDGNLYGNSWNVKKAIRPVINLRKSAIRIGE